jgi:hypothetical protein
LTGDRGQKSAPPPRPAPSQKSHPPQRSAAAAQPAASGGFTTLAVLCIVAIAISTIAIVLTLVRSSSTASDPCKTAAWDALPAQSELPDGWSMTASNYFISGVGSSLVGPTPSDGSSSGPTVFLTVTCYGDESHEVMTRSHDSAIAAGDRDVPFTDLGDESFATTDAATSGTAVYIRQGPLVATMATQGSVDQGDLQQAAAAVADGLSGAGSAASGPGSTPGATSVAVAPTSSGDSGADASDVPSHVSPALEATLPSSVAGTALISQSTTGTSALGDDESSQALVASLAKAGKKPSDLVIAEAYDPNGALDVEVIAFKVDGVKGPALEQAVLDSWLAGGSSGVTTKKETISGKEVTHVDYGDGGSFDYLYEKNDVVYDVSTSDPTVAAEALKTLP